MLTLHTLMSVPFQNLKRQKTQFAGMPQQHQLDQRDHHTQSPTLHCGRSPEVQMMSKQSLKASKHHLLNKSGGSSHRSK